MSIGRNAPGVYWVNTEKIDLIWKYLLNELVFLFFFKFKVQAPYVLLNGNLKVLPLDNPNAPPPPDFSESFRRSVLYVGRRKISIYLQLRSSSESSLHV